MSRLWLPTPRQAHPCPVHRNTRWSRRPAAPDCERARPSAASPPAGRTACCLLPTIVGGRACRGKTARAIQIAAAEPHLNEFASGKRALGRYIASCPAERFLVDIRRRFRRNIVKIEFVVRL